MKTLEEKNLRLEEEIERLSAENAGMKELKDRIAAFRTFMGGATLEMPALAAPAVSVKRERIKDEDDTEILIQHSTSRNRLAKRTKIVDLTDD